MLIPAYNEEASLSGVIINTLSVLKALGWSYELIVVDDGSNDKTAEVAESAGAKVVRHPYNIGNGAAVKTAIRHARGSILIMMDADGQHNPEDIPRLLDKIEQFDLVVGARDSNSQTAFHRDVANQLYNLFASYICGRKIEDLTSGFRAVKGNLARSFVYLLPNTFSYPTTLTLATVRSGFSLAYIPISTPSRLGKSKIRLLRDGARFLLIILKIATFFSPLKVFVPASIAIFLTGFFYGLFKIIVLGSRYGPTSAMLMTMAILVFLVGLVSEQVAQLRFDRAE